MDEKVKPGDHLKINRCKQRGWLALMIVLIVIFFPVIVLFLVPYTLCRDSWRRSQGRNLAYRGLLIFLNFIFGLLANILFLPQILVVIILVLIKYALLAIFYTLTCYCFWSRHRNPV